MILSHASRSWNSSTTRRCDMMWHIIRDRRLNLTKMTAKIFNFIITNTFFWQTDTQTDTPNSRLSVYNRKYFILNIYKSNINYHNLLSTKIANYYHKWNKCSLYPYWNFPLHGHCKYWNPRNKFSQYIGYIDWQLAWNSVIWLNCGHQKCIHG